MVAWLGSVRGTSTLSPQVAPPCMPASGLPRLGLLCAICPCLLVSQALWKQAPGSDTLWGPSHPPPPPQKPGSGALHALEHCSASQQKDVTQHGDRW